MNWRSNDHLPLFESLGKMRAKWPTRGWSWDTRLVCAASSFSGDFEEPARVSIAEALPTVWTPSTLNQAPQRFRDFIDTTGGLRAGQVAFSGESPRGLMAFGLWWPWRDQRTVSMRVGFVGVPEMAEAYQRFRDIFSVSM